MKLALALTTPGVDVRAVVQTQRGATMRTLQDYTRLKTSADRPADLAWRLVLDSMLFQAEAEMRWLDHCEASLARYSPPPVSVRKTAPSGAKELSVVIALIVVPWVAMLGVGLLTRSRLPIERRL